MGLDDSTDRDSIRTKPDAPTAPLPEFAPNPNGGEPTVTLSQRDRLQAETGLLFGLLALANGLIPQESLTRAFGAWALEPGRSFREVLVERGHLDESGASLVDTLAERHLEQHHGIAWESLIALGKVVQFRFDPKEVADSELRVILGGFVAKGGDPPRPSKVGEGDGFRSRYQNIEHHASGGLGVVSKARDMEMCREVALKEIRPDCADNLDYRARFVREAEVTGRLEHPGIVPVYGIGHHDDGRPYYIMRFIRGETLKVAIGRLHKPSGDEDEAGPADRPDLHALVGRFIDACHAVAYAHHRKVLHRDIKPINIMLGPYGETLVVDWGLAKSFEGPRSDEFPIEEGTLRPESGSELTPTRIGSQVGTTGYMSPEQAAGRLLELSPTSDIYSLGVTLHYLATGHAPFEGSGKEEFLRRVREGDFPRPCKVNPSVPRPLEAICLKAMALRPIDRYQSAEALVEDLERWRAGQPVLAYPEPPIDRLARWAKGRKTTLVGTSVLMACCIVGLAIYAEVVREKNQRLVADFAASERVGLSSVTNRRASLKALNRMLQELDGPDLTFLAKSEDVRAKMADGLLESYRDLLRREPLDKQLQFDLARACQVVANIGRAVGKLERPRLLYLEAIRLIESLGDWNPGPGDVRITLVTVYNDSAEHYRMAGRPEKALEEFARGLETIRSTVSIYRRSRDRFTEAKLQLDLSRALMDLGRFDPATEANRRAIGLLEARPDGVTPDPKEPILLVHARLVRASLMRLTGQLEPASTELNQTRQLAEDLVAQVSAPDTHLALASVRIEQGLLRLQVASEETRDEALAAFHEAWLHLESLYRDHPRTIEFQRALAAALIGRGACHLSIKKLEPARADLAEARRLLDRLDATIPDHFRHLEQLGWALTNLGRVCRAEGNDEARGLLLNALESIKAAHKLNPDSPVGRDLLAETQEELTRFEAKTWKRPASP